MNVAKLSAFAFALMTGGLLLACSADAPSPDPSADEQAVREERIRYTEKRSKASGGGSHDTSSAAPHSGDVSTQMFDSYECIQVDACRCCWKRSWLLGDGEGGATCQGC